MIDAITSFLTLTNIPQLLASLVGAGVAILTALLTIRAQFNYQERRQAAEGRARTARILKLFRTDIETIWSLYHLQIGPAIEVHASTATTTPFTVRFPLFQNYLAIFDRNAGALADIEGDAARDHIVRLYGHAKTSIDTFALHARLLDRLEAGGDTGQVEEQLLAFFPRILDRHQRFVAAREQALAAIDAELSRLEAKS
jgi:hypothetical protein